MAITLNSGARMPHQINFALNMTKQNTRVGWLDSQEETAVSDYPVWTRADLTRVVRSNQGGAEGCIFCIRIGKLLIYIQIK